MNKKNQEGRKLEASRDRDPTDLQTGSSQVITDPSWLSVVTAQNDVLIQIISTFHLIQVLPSS